MSTVEGRGPIDSPPPLIPSCNIFRLMPSRVGYVLISLKPGFHIVVSVVSVVSVLSKKFLRQIHQCRSQGRGRGGAIIMEETKVLID